MERQEAEIDQEHGAAVVLDEEDQEDEDEEEFEIKDESDEEEEEEAAEAGSQVAGDEDGDTIQVGGESSKTKKTKVDKDLVPPHKVDAFWVQRQISDVYPDPVVSAEKANSVLTILGSESGARDCENQLMELFDFENFQLITCFLKNCDVIVWCTKWRRSDADSQVDVEVAMRKKCLGWILRQLAGDRQAKGESDAMEVDEPKEVFFHRVYTDPELAIGVSDVPPLLLSG